MTVSFASPVIVTGAGDWQCFDPFVRGRRVTWRCPINASFGWHSATFKKLPIPFANFRENEARKILVQLTFFSHNMEVALAEGKGDSDFDPAKEKKNQKVTRKSYSLKVIINYALLTDTRETEIVHHTRVWPPWPSTTRSYALRGLQRRSRERRKNPNGTHGQIRVYRLTLNFLSFLSPHVKFIKPYYI